jgi:hypothetical protein
MTTDTSTPTADTETTTCPETIRYRETAAYWFATGIGADHDVAYTFSQDHKREAGAYYHELRTSLPSIPDAWAGWCERNAAHLPAVAR